MRIKLRLMEKQDANLLAHLGFFASDAGDFRVEL